VLQRRKTREEDHAAIAALVAELEGERIVVGLPLSLDGSMGPAAVSAAEEAAALGDVVGVPVETYDERLTTVTADRSLSSLGLPGQARRRVVDKVAAAVMLQAWLDRSKR
jgi:putative pre-16S rRNA nuclease